LGSEPTPALFIEHLVTIFDEVRRVLRPDGLCFVNIGDSYAGSGKGPSGSNGIGDQEERQGFAGSKQHANAGSLTIGNHEPDYRGIPAKNLILIPQRFAIGMQDRGWMVRSCIAWCKTSAMPESVRDRPTSAWEPIWMFAKSARYFYDADAVRQPAAPRTLNETREARRRRAGWSGRPNVVGEGPSDANAEGGANLRNYWLLSAPSPPAWSTTPASRPRSRAAASWPAPARRAPARPAGRRGPESWSGTKRPVTRRHISGRSTDDRLGAVLHLRRRRPGAVRRPRSVPRLRDHAHGRIAARSRRHRGRAQRITPGSRGTDRQDAGSLFGEPVAVEMPRQLDIFGEATA
jgi:hypothetical protein